MKSKGLSSESLEVISASVNTLTSSINCYGDKGRLEFTGSVLQQKKLYTAIKNCKSLCGLWNNKLSWYK